MRCQEYQLNSFLLIDALAGMKVNLTTVVYRGREMVNEIITLP